MNIPPTAESTLSTVREGTKKSRFSSSQSTRGRGLFVASSANPTFTRKFNDHTEWMLDQKIFNDIIARYGTPDIDLFASRLNHQLPRYVAWEPDPGAEAIDAFSIDWGGMFFYAFPPFCLVGRCLQKIMQDFASGILVVPNWRTQPWFPLLFGVLTEPPMVVHRHKYLFIQPVFREPHPLHDRINLSICRI